MRFVREFDYTLLGQRVHVTDEVDISLVRPRPRKYEKAGAASAAATAGSKSAPPQKASATEETAGARASATVRMEEKT